MKFERWHRRALATAYLLFLGECYSFAVHELAWFGCNIWVASILGWTVLFRVAFSLAKEYFIAEMDRKWQRGKSGW